jgi:hypothetical protein
MGPCSQLTEFPLRLYPTVSLVLMMMMMMLMMIHWRSRGARAAATRAPCQGEWPCSRWPIAKGFGCLPSAA